MTLNVLQILFASLKKLTVFTPPRPFKPCNEGKVLFLEWRNERNVWATTVPVTEHSSERLHWLY